MPRVKLGRKPNDEVLISLLWGRQAAIGMPVGTCEKGPAHAGGDVPGPPSGVGAVHLGDLREGGS